MEQTREYVGIDLHRHRSVIVRKAADGTLLETTRIDNGPLALAKELSKAGPNPEVVLEATQGWYWAADVIAENGGNLHLAHPLGNNWGTRRVKNDERDAEDLVDLLRLGRLSESWISPPEVRDLRELVRYRLKLRQMRSGLRCQVHQVLAKEGIQVPVSDLFGKAGNTFLDGLFLEGAYKRRVESARDLLYGYDVEIEILDATIAKRLHDHAGYRAIQQIPGIGPVLGAVFVSEIGDVHRFTDARHLASWAGLTPRHRESDDKVHRGQITKQGSRLVRWAAVETVAKGRTASAIREAQRSIAARRGTHVARVAAARKVLTLVYYGLRDGEIRCLAKRA